MKRNQHNKKRHQNQIQTTTSRQTSSTQNMKNKSSVSKRPRSQRQQRRKQRDKTAQLYQIKFHILRKQSTFHHQKAVKVVIHVEMPKTAPKKSNCHFQKLEMILK